MGSSGVRAGDAESQDAHPFGQEKGSKAEVSGRALALRHWSEASREFATVVADGRSAEKYPVQEYATAEDAESGGVAGGRQGAQRRPGVSLKADKEDEKTKDVEGGRGSESRVEVDEVNAVWRRTRSKSKVNNPSVEQDVDVNGARELPARRRLRRGSRFQARSC